MSRCKYHESASQREALVEFGRALLAGVTAGQHSVCPLPDVAVPKGGATSREPTGLSYVENVMKNDGEVRVLASRLVEVLGEGAARHALCRLVELTAANETRAAAFWRDVMHMCEELASRQVAPPTVSDPGQAADIAAAGD